MQKINELTVISNGPASEYSTWSNVPFLFTQALRGHGVKVNLVDIIPWPPGQKIHDYTFRQLWKLVHPDSTYTYFRSWLHFQYTRARIWMLTGRFQLSRANVFLKLNFCCSGKPFRFPEGLITQSALSDPHTAGKTGAYHRR